MQELSDDVLAKKWACNFYRPLKWLQQWAAPLLGTNHMLTEEVRLEWTARSLLSNLLLKAGSAWMLDCVAPGLHPARSWKSPRMDTAALLFFPCWSVLMVKIFFTCSLNVSVFNSLNVRSCRSRALSSQVLKISKDRHCNPFLPLLECPHGENILYMQSECLCFHFTVSRSSQYIWLWGALPCLFSSLQVGTGRLLSGPLKSSVFQVEQAQLTQPLLIRQVGGPPLNLLQAINVFLILAAQNWAQYCICGQT